jgi:hypothetical protein
LNGGRRKAGTQSRRRQVSKKPKEPNILSNITNNPYQADNYSMLTKVELKRALRWKTILRNYYGKKSSIAE